MVTQWVVANEDEEHEESSDEEGSSDQSEEDEDPQPPVAAATPIATAVKPKISIKLKGKYIDLELPCHVSVQGTGR